jgi:hypothetical protein
MLHNLAQAPSTLPEELLLARFILVRRDGAQPPLSPIYDGPYQVLERSTHSIDNATNNNFILIISIWPSASQCPAAEPTQPLSLPPQSLGGGGTCGGVPSDRHVTYYTSHMLYICTYSP